MADTASLRDAHMAEIIENLNRGRDPPLSHVFEQAQCHCPAALQLTHDILFSLPEQHTHGDQ
ncbi:hypothetical protein GCM10007418_20820 [Halopseudomonas salina]|uniref:Uncharacterized protein n=1 Tax=Halopseudomonas salina TaxID=1323744 RepID=A0ABQ1PQD5_9GAMM|nr:hypothetical protein GCM10007418_20820 [Halopseudomonas salina]